MFDLKDPAWWKSLAAVVAAFLALFNVPGNLSQNAQAVVGGVGLLIAGVYIHERHSTTRNQDTAAATAGTNAAAAALNAKQAGQQAAQEAHALLEHLLGGTVGLASSTGVPSPTPGPVSPAAPPGPGPAAQATS